MHIIQTWAELAAYLDSPIDPALAQLLRTRREQLVDYGDLRDLGTFAIVQPGDTLAAIEAALELPIAINIIDEKRFGEPDFMPSWEAIDLYDGWFELCFVLSDDGFGHVVILPDAEGIDPTLLELCRTYANRPDDEAADRAGTV